MPDGVAPLLSEGVGFAEAASAFETAGVTLAEGEAGGVPDGEAPLLSEGVGEALRIAVGEGVGEEEIVLVAVAVTVGEDVGVGVGEVGAATTALRLEAA